MNQEEGLNEMNPLNRAQLYATITSLETDLRSILRGQIAPHLHDDDLYGDLHERLTNRRSAEGRSASTADLVDYLDFADAFTLLNRHSGLLEAVTARTIARLTSQLERLVGPRNRVMHARPLLEDDQPAVARAYGDLRASSLALTTFRLTLDRVESDPSWLPDVPPPPKSRVAHNLPLPDFDETGLMGRHGEAAALLSHLLKRRERILTVVGEGGIGKTAVAVKVLHDLIAHDDCPYLAVMWTSLKTERLAVDGVQSLTTSAVHVLQDLGHWLHVVGDTSGSDVGALAEILEDLPVLLVIDNIETVSAEEVVELYDQLPVTCSFLLTSRVGLGQLERRIPIGPLDTKDATRLLRTHAKHRNVDRLATASEAALTGQAKRLRGNPLAVRWFVEAVEVGGDPVQLLADQSMVLSFCLQTIFDGLNTEAQTLLDVMLVTKRPTFAADFVFFANLEFDAVRRGLQDLLRRSLVLARVDRQTASIESYELTASATLYLTKRHRISPDVANEVNSKLRAIRSFRESQELDRSRGPLNPHVIAELDGWPTAIPFMLDEAIQLGRGDETKTDALRRASQAQELAPETSEVTRVLAYLLSRISPDESSERYEEALVQAEEPEQIARINYFYSEHLAHQAHDLVSAIRAARAAHDVLRLPVTGGRLGRYLGRHHEWEESEELLLAATSDTDARSALIAHTYVLEMAAKRATFLAQTQRNPSTGLRSATSILLAETSALATGWEDGQFEAAFIDLCETLVEIASAADTLTEVDSALLKTFEAIDRLAVPAMARPQGRSLMSGLEALSKREDISTAVSTRASRLAGVLQARGATAAGELATVKVFKGPEFYGFLRSASDEDIFFHGSVLTSQLDALALIPGAPVRFERGEPTDKGQVASTLTAERAPIARREAVVKQVEPRHAIVEDPATGLRAFAHATEFAAVHFDSLRASDTVVATFGEGTTGLRAFRVAPG